MKIYVEAIGTEINAPIEYRICNQCAGLSSDWSFGTLRVILCYVTLFGFFILIQLLKTYLTGPCWKNLHEDITFQPGSF